MKWIKFISSLVISYVLGFTLSKGLSATNTLKYKNEVLKHELPFIYTVGINEMLIVLIITMLISIVSHAYYEKSQSSQKQILKLFCGILWIECILFSLILGTWQEKILSSEESGFIYEYSLLIISIFIYILVIFFLLNKKDNVTCEKEEDDLFESRKKLLPMIKFYLENSKGFSIIGDWGIGKTKLIKNFFEKSKNEFEKKYGEYYELIYIDVSTFSDNKKIIQEIEEQINLIFRKNKILKLETDLLESLFNETSTWFKNLKNIIFEKNYLKDSKSSLCEKIKELKKNKNKEIVLCLDNLERIIDRERIVNLLAVIDDITTDNIKKIYVYDKKHMEVIFEEIAFDNYIEKYSEGFIEVKEVLIEEVIIDSVNFKLIEFNLILKKMGKLQEIKDKKIKEKVIEKIEEAQRNLTNPRKLLNIQKFINNKKIQFPDKIKIEYKLLIDLFGEFNFNDEVQKNLFFENFRYENRKKYEMFQALAQGKFSLDKIDVELEKDKLKKEALCGEDLKIIEFIKYCEKQGLEKEKSELFKQLKIYDIKNLENLQDIISLIYDKVDINIDKMRIIYKKNFFNSSKDYDLEEIKSFIKIILIRSNLKNFKEISRILFKNLNEYDELYKLAPVNFEKGLKKIKGINLEEFINSVKKIKKRNTFNLINLEELKEELKILDKIDTMKKQEKLEEKFETKLKEKAFLEMGEVFNLSGICNVSDLNINIKIDYLEINENINEENIELYEKHFLKLDKKIHVVKKILMEIYLLKRRIRHSKLKNLKLNRNKLKKYYKNN